MRKAVILAAGRGTRMGPLTAELPKPMLPIAGKPMLEHILDRFGAAGFGHAFIVTGHRAELIEDHFAGYPMEIEFRRQVALNGTGAAALLAREFAAGDSFLLTYGDILVAPDNYRSIAAQLEGRAATAGVLAVKYVDDPYQGAAVYEDNGSITSIVEKPPRGTSSTNWNSAGLYAFRPLVFDYLDGIPPSPRGEYELPTAIERMITAGQRLEIHAIQGAWRDVGRPGDIAAAERDVTSGY